MDGKTRVSESETGSVVKNRRAEGGSGVGSGDKTVYGSKKMERVSDEESVSSDEDFGGNGLMRLRRNEVDVYDFDEYDDLGDSEFESGSSKGDIIPGKRRFVMGKEGTERCGSSDEVIRLQGKNGLLKVRVKNKTEVNEQRPLMYGPMEGSTLIHRGQEITAKSIVIQRHSSYSERNVPLSAKSSEESDEESDSVKVKVRQPMKRGRKAKSLQSPEVCQPIKAKVKRGTGTEKQLLREKIKSMLISAGWTIDYRPRRGRDYSDAVYVNPNGTTFWSIIKAYDAFQKQLEVVGTCVKASDDSPSLAPIPEDTLSKLTRQTRKKMEKELKRKKMEEIEANKKLKSRNFEGHESDAGSQAVVDPMKN